jgi:hypothetical protein
MSATKLYAVFTAAKPRIQITRAFTKREDADTYHSYYPEDQKKNYVVDEIRSSDSREDPKMVKFLIWVTVIGFLLSIALLSLLLLKTYNY